jgi:hypothetical protein
MAASETQEVELITVGKPVDDGKAVWDRWPGHPANYEQPAGEVFISDMRPYQVDRNSPGISQKLGERALREIDDRAARQRVQAHEAAARQRTEAREAAVNAQQANAVFVPPTSGQPVPAAQQPPQETPPSEDEDGGEDDGEQAQSTQAGGTLPRPSRGRRTTGSTETPPER